MPRYSSTELVRNIVQEYLDGEKERMFFYLVFNHYFIQHYPKMERESPALADCYTFYLYEEGIDCTDGLCDAEHKKLIYRQFKGYERWVLLMGAFLDTA